MRLISFFAITCLLLILLTTQTHAQNITTVAGNGTNGFGPDGVLATSSALRIPTDVFIDEFGDMYIADNTNHRVRKVGTNGIITTVAGNGTGGLSGDGGLATAAMLRNPSSVYAENGVIYIADNLNNSIRKVDSNGIITTVAGNGSPGFSGDGGQATNAQLKNPYGVFLSGGELYIADEGNLRVRKVDSNGIITTVAGNGSSSFSGDGGQATSASLDPAKIHVLQGVIYIADFSNNRIRQVDANGIISTIAGNGTNGFGPDNVPATSSALSRPDGIFVANGELYIADENNSRIRKVDVNGIITTVAGNGTYGFSGDGGPATTAMLSNPIGIYVNQLGEIFFADSGNNRVRKFTLPPPPIFADVATTSGITSAIESTHGMAWGDFDNDGDPDLYVVNLSHPNHFYRNDNGSFVDIASNPGTDLLGPANTISAGWADYDNDGDLDLYVATNPGDNKLYRNDGGEQFSDISPAGAPGSGKSFDSIWGDYDNDGFVDLYIVMDSAANLLYRNKGDASFELASAGVGASGLGRAAAWADYDDDGDLDLYAVNCCNGTTFNYRNNGNGTFAGLGALVSGGNLHAVNFIDYDNDTDLDIQISNAAGTNYLFQNQGSPAYNFVDVSNPSGIADPRPTVGASWGDFDNDGNIDLHLANSGDTNRLYHNQGNSSFIDLIASGPNTGLNNDTNSSHSSWADYDGDGDLDLYVGMSDAPNRLYRNNNNNGNSWLALKLEGTTSDRSAIGAVVMATIGGTTQRRDLNAGNSILSQNSLAVEFGLGAATQVDALTIYWPSGFV